MRMEYCPKYAHSSPSSALQVNQRRRIQLSANPCQRVPRLDSNALDAKDISTLGIAYLENYINLISLAVINLSFSFLNSNFSI